MQKIYSAFETVDNFGTTPSLNFKGDSNAHSTCGGLLTLGFIALAISSCITSASDLVNKTNPSVVVSQETLDEHPRQKVGVDGDFRVGIGFINQTDFRYITPDPSLIQVYGIRYKDDEDGNTQLWGLNTEICDENNAQGLSEAIGRSYCISSDQIDDNEMTVANLWNEAIMLFARPCIQAIDEANGITCKDDAEIYDAISNMFVTIYYTELGVSPDNYENPLNLQESQKILTVGTDYAKVLHMVVGTTDMTTDNGFYFRSESKVTHSYLESVLAESDSNLEDGFFNLYLYSGTKQVKYQRTYTKIQDVLAEVGGMTQLGLLVIAIFFGLYLEDKFYEKTINSIYDVKLNYQDKKKGSVGVLDLIKQGQISQNRGDVKVEDLQKESRLNNQLDNSAFGMLIKSKKQDTSKVTPTIEPNDTSYMGGTELKQQEEQEESKGNHDDSPQKNTVGEVLKDHEEDIRDHNQEEISLSLNKDKSQYLSLNYAEWLLQYICCKRHKIKQKSKAFKRAKDEIDESLDVLSLLTRIQEIDKLKACILNEDQYILFEGLPKPKLEINPTPRGKMFGEAFKQMMRECESEKSRIKLIERAYVKIKSNPNRSKMDMQLLKIYEEAKEKAR